MRPRLRVWISSRILEAAGRLLAQREDYEALGVFPAGLIDSWASHLMELGDMHLRDDLADSKVSVEELVARYFHVGYRRTRWSPTSRLRLGPIATCAC